jgi:hypothetical protein
MAQLLPQVTALLQESTANPQVLPVQAIAWVTQVLLVGSQTCPLAQVPQAIMLPHRSPI